MTKEELNEMEFGSDDDGKVFFVEGAEGAMTKVYAWHSYQQTRDPKSIRPDYYQVDKLEVWDVLDTFFPSSPLLWNAGKYLLRAGRKGDAKEDVRKAITYLERYLEKE